MAVTVYQVGEQVGGHDKSGLGGDAWRPSRYRTYEGIIGFALGAGIP